MLKHPPGARACEAPTSEWRVITRFGNYSKFNGGRFTPSRYSALACGRCGYLWRTDAQYVADVRSASPAEQDLFTRFGYLPKYQPAEEGST